MGDFQDAYKITSADRSNKGVTGLPDTPGLSTGDMQARFDSLGNLAIDKFNSMVDSVGDAVTNDDTKLPTMKAIVDYVVSMGGGDMTKAVYDTDNDGVVDNSGGKIRFSFQQFSHRKKPWFSTSLKALNSMIIN